jgi:hypothetical protein
LDVDVIRSLRDDAAIVSAHRQRRRDIRLRQ